MVERLDMSKQEELLQMSREHLNTALEQVVQLGRDAGLSARGRLVLVQTAKTAGALISVSGLVLAAGGPHHQDIINKLDEVVVALSILGSTAIAEDAAILKDSEGEAARLAMLVTDAIKVIVGAVTNLSQQIRGDDELVKAAKEINEQRRGNGETLQ